MPTIPRKLPSKGPQAVNDRFAAGVLAVLAAWTAGFGYFMTRGGAEERFFGAPNDPRRLQREAAEQDRRNLLMNKPRGDPTNLFIKREEEKEAEQTLITKDMRKVLRQPDLMKKLDTWAGESMQIAVTKAPNVAENDDEKSASKE